MSGRGLQVGRSKSWVVISIVSSGDIRDWLEKETDKEKGDDKAVRVHKGQGSDWRGGETCEQHGERKVQLSLCHRVHIFLQPLGCNLVLRSLFSLSTCSSYSATFYPKQQHICFEQDCLQKLVHILINHHLAQKQLQICDKKPEGLAASLSDLRNRVVVINLSIMLFTILTLITVRTQNFKKCKQEPSTLSNDSSSLVKEAK